MQSMTMQMDNIIRTFLKAAIIMLLPAFAACSRVGIEPEKPAGQEAVLAATRGTIITKSGDDAVEFDVGTKYLLYASSVSADWTNPLLYNSEGTETASHTIAYSPVLNYPSSGALSIFGITVDKSETDWPGQEVLTTSSSGTPTATLSRPADGSALPDLMWSSNLSACTAQTSGYRLDMEYRHALSKVKFMIVKQDESADTEKKLENVRLSAISISGVHGSGTLDIGSGSWNYGSDSADETYTAYRAAAGSEMVITIANQEVQGSGVLIFPNPDTEEVKISVTLTGLETDPKTVEYALRAVDAEGNDTGPFVFLPNHEYTLIITVLKDEVRTIAIAPQVYDWVDVDLSSDETYLGQPVTFASLMWMDRNLGAKSADCVNDWENCRGYYYQYARNIPYILDKAKYDAANPKDNIYTYLYTYDQNGKKVYGGYMAGATTADGVAVREPNIAINPGDDKPIYQFIWDYNNQSTGNWHLAASGSAEDPSVNTFWYNNTENHPCPKGWRLPTREDFATFLPERSLGAGGNWYSGYRSFFNYDANTLGYKEDVVCGTINGERAIYVIKRRGRTDCYRLRIRMLASDTRGKWYYEFAMFSGDATMSLAGATTEALFNNLTLDWSTPSSIMTVPCSGFIHTAEGAPPATPGNTNAHMLNRDGESAILRSSDYSTRSYNWVCYLRPDYNFGLFSDSRKALGDQIRCVRDINQ